MSGLLIPSYAQGFAPRDGPPENPGLWKGLVGFWAPHLGPTGLTLRDWSGFQNHGTLTSMDPATDWMSSLYGWALDFDGTDDYVDCGASASLNVQDCFSITANIRRRVIGTSHPIVAKKDNGGTYPGYAFRVWSTNLLAVHLNHDEEAWEFGNATLTNNQRYSVAWTYDGTTSLLYIDGQLDATLPMAKSSAAPAVSMRIGRSTFDAQKFNGQIGRISIYNRILAPSEIQHLYADPHALTRLRRRVFASTVAPPIGIPQHMMYFKHMRSQ